MRYDIEQSHVLCSTQFTYLWNKGIALNDPRVVSGLQFLWIYTVHRKNKWFRVMGGEVQRDGWKWPRKKNVVEGWGKGGPGNIEGKKGKRGKDWVISNSQDWVREDAVDLWSKETPDKI